MLIIRSGLLQQDVQFKGQFPKQGVGSNLTYCATNVSFSFQALQSELSRAQEVALALDDRLQENRDASQLLAQCVNR